MCTWLSFASSVQAFFVSFLTTVVHFHPNSINPCWFLSACRRLSVFHLRGGGREKRKPKRDVGGTSRRVTDGDDPMDCNYEVEEEEMGSKKKAPLRRLPEPSRTPSSSEGEEDEGSTDEGLEYNPRLVVSPLMCQTCLPEGRSGMRTTSNPTTVDGH